MGSNGGKRTTQTAKMVHLIRRLSIYYILTGSGGVGGLISLEVIRKAEEEDHSRLKSEEEARIAEEARAEAEEE